MNVEISSSTVKDRVCTKCGSRMNTSVIMFNGRKLTLQCSVCRHFVIIQDL